MHVISRRLNSLAQKASLYAVVALAAAALLPTAANATMTINITQVGGNVVATSSGSVDLSGVGLQFITPGEYEGIVGSFIGINSNHVAPGDEIFAYTGLSLVHFGSGGPIPSSSSSGDPFCFWGDPTSGYADVCVAGAYLSGDMISEKATWVGQSFASLGLTTGTYTSTDLNGNAAVILNIGVPEPSTWATMLLGFGAVAAGMRINRKRRPASA